VAYFAQLPVKLGAHPIWADHVLVIGAIGGTLCAIVTLRIGYAKRILLFSGLATLSAAAAYIGKTRFAASFAEDAFAGQMWYFGWHAICIFVVAATITGAYRK
jgi:hypothetical protein